MTEVIRTGRPTDDPKQYVLTVRINEETKNQLFSVAKKDNIPVSNLVRDYIENGLRKGR